MGHAQHGASWPSCIDAPATVGTSTRDEACDQHRECEANPHVGVPPFARTGRPAALLRPGGSTARPSGSSPLRPARSPRATQTAERWLADSACSAVIVCFGEPFVSLVKSILLHECATEHELRHRDLTGVVGTVVEQLESLACEPFGLGVLARDRGGRGRASQLRCAASASVSCSSATRERGLEVLDRLLRAAEHVVQAAEVVQQPADVHLVLELLVQRLRALRVGAREMSGRAARRRATPGSTCSRCCAGRRDPATARAPRSTSSRAASKSRWRR